MPDILQVHWYPPGPHQHDVDPYLVGSSAIAGDQPLGSSGHTPQPIFVDRDRQCDGIAARLDLNEGKNFPAPCNQIDLAALRADPFADNPPTLQPQPPSGKALAMAALALGGLPVQSPSLIAIARA